MRLQRLTIEDFGLIVRAEVELAGGLTVFTGETGSGKTMLLGALAFALGARAGADQLRGGATRARVTLELEPDPALCAALEAQGLAADAGETIVIVREINAAGRSVARVNGIPAAAAQLRALGEHLVETVGQHEAQRLLAPAYHLELVDRYGGAELAAARAAVAGAYAAHAEASDALERARGDAGRAAAEYELARAGQDEIDAAEPVAGEDAALRERRGYLTNVERIAAALQGALDALGGEGGASDALGAAAQGLAGVARFSEPLGALAAQLGALQSEANDVAVALAREREAAEYDPAELDALTERLETLERLKRRYGGTIEEVARTRARFAEVVDAYVSRDERRAALERRCAELAAELAVAIETLRALRRASAERLRTAVERELATLAMPAARFAVALEPAESPGPNGADRCEFLLAPHPGEPPRPLARSASGGELARTLLAVIVVLAGAWDRTALVFDEIDAGIGGAAANAVGARLGRLALGAQVVVVTHLAQIASWADAHYALRKEERDGATTIALVALDPAERDREIARMLAGETQGVALDHARTLLREVAGRKTSLAAK